MKLFRYATTTIVLTVASSAFAARATATENVPVSIENVFVPQEGYDDNDSIEVVVDGELPNSCYTVERTEVTRDTQDPTLFRISQVAVRSKTGLCAQSSEDMPVHLQATVPYTTEVNLGRLDAGDYKIAFKAGQSQRNDTFKVAPAPTENVDSLPYAHVSNALVSDVVGRGKDVLLTLAGTLRSSCTTLNEKTGIQKVGDVVIVLPTVAVELGPICMQVIRNFTQTVNLGQMEPGRYNAHVRSKNGKAVNRVFSVVEKVDE